MVRSSRSEHSADSRSSRRSTGSTRSTITIKSTDTSLPKQSRRNSALDAMIYFAGGNPRRVKAVRHNEVTTEWDDDYSYPTTRHQMYFVSAKQDWYSGWGYDDAYALAPRRSESRRSNPIPVQHRHPGGPGPRQMPMGGPPGPMFMGRGDDDSSSSSGSDDDGWSENSAGEYGPPPPPPVGPEFGDQPFMGGPPHPGMMPPHMHPQGHFAGPPQGPPPPQQGGDAPFFKVN